MVGNKKKSFWQTWPGALLGSLVIVGVSCLWFFYPGLHLESQPELEEIRQQLMQGEYFKGEFKYLASIDAEWNLPQGKGPKRPLKWKTTSRGEIKTGYYTLCAVGYRKLSDQRMDSVRFVVRFSKQGDEPLRIIRLEDEYGRLLKWTEALLR